MTLLSRLSRLFQADVHAILDQIEEPALLLKQAIREMEDVLDQDDRHIRLLSLEQLQRLGQQAELNSALAELEANLALCFMADKDDLAYALIKRKLEIQQSLKWEAAKLAELSESLAQLNVQFKEHQTQLQVLKQKAQIVMDDNRDTVSLWRTPLSAIRDEDVAIAFLYEKNKRSAS